MILVEPHLLIWVVHFLRQGGAISPCRWCNQTGICKQAVQEEMLKEEGHTFIAAGHGIFSGIKVDGWKDKLI